MDMDADRLGAVLSREELRFEYVDEQGWDASCGYAALASLLGRYRGLPVTEAELLAQEAPGPGSGQGVVVQVSLGGLVRIVRRLGFEARPWRATFEALVTLVDQAPPVLVHYDRPQGHYALVLSAGPQGLVTADPARGLELLTRDQFLARWSGAALEVRGAREAENGRAEAEKASRRVWARKNLIERALSKALPPM